MMTEIAFLTPLEAIVASWSVEEHQRANQIVREYERHFDRYNWPLDTSRWGYNLREYKYKAQQDIAIVEDDIKKHAEARKLHWLEIDAWAKRQRVFHSERGSAAILQPDFERWLKKVAKCISTQKARKGYERLEVIDRKTVQIFDTVTLDFAENMITAYVWSVGEFGMALSALAERLPCASPFPFTARIELETLQSLVKWLPAERIDLSTEDNHLIVAAHRTRTRIKFISMNPFTVGYWKGFLPDENA